jgi:hypothetical protein
MSKTPSTRSYTVIGQIEADGVTYAAGSTAELSEAQAASLGDCVKRIEPAHTSTASGAPAAPVAALAAAPAAAKTAKAD